MKEQEIERLNNLKKYEENLYNEGIKFICGIDEAGRGPLAGPVSVGAVVMNRVNSGAYPDTIGGVIYASGQFTPTKSGRVEKLAVNSVKDSCLQAARAAMAGETPVGGAMHFRRAGKHDGIVIGDHVFW